jgi:hypothetical protein
MKMLEEADKIIAITGSVFEAAAAAPSLPMTRRGKKVA